MKYKKLFLSVLFLPTIALSVIWLHKRPQDILSGTHDFFFPFLKEENSSLVRNYDRWAQEVLAYFADKIQQYPTSEYSKDSDHATVQQAYNRLQKEYRQLQDTLRSDKKVVRTTGACSLYFSAKQRKKLYRLLRKTAAELFGMAPRKMSMMGVQGPKLVDFERRAAIEELYETLHAELESYQRCSNLLEPDILLIHKTYKHILQAYETVLDVEGLRTMKLMEHV